MTSDLSLIVRLRRGDEAAFDELFRSTYPTLVRVATGLVRCRAVAEEIAQEVMLELWRRREMLVMEGSPHAYLLQSARNRALNHLRHERVLDRAAPMIERESTRSSHSDVLVLEDELATAVRQAIDGLPPRTKEVFELSRVHALTYAEIAESLAISIKTVEAQMGRALRMLREQLAPWLPGGENL